MTLSVKLCRARAELHRDHKDQHFCRANIYGLEEVASILGLDQVGYQTSKVVIEKIFNYTS